MGRVAARFRLEPVEKGRLVFFGAAASKPPQGGAATQTRDSFGKVPCRAQRTQIPSLGILCAARGFKENSLTQ
jgi:hypothetical protein